MTFEELFWIAMAVLVMMVLPIAMIVGAWHHLRSAKQRRNDGQTARSRVAFGNALQELDRFVTRPSVEFTIEADRPILKREDDKGGE